MRHQYIARLEVLKSAGPLTTLAIPRACPGPAGVPTRTRRPSRLRTPRSSSWARISAGTIFIIGSSVHAGSEAVG